MKKSMSRSNARRSPSSENSSVVVARPERVERAVDLEDPEEVVEPVVEGVRVALDVEEQIARRGWRERGQTALGLDLGSPGPGRSSSYFGRASRRPSSWIRACSRTRSEGARRSMPSSGGSIGSGRSPSASSVGDPALGQRAALASRDPGDEAQVVVGASAGRALGRPATDVAVLDRVGIGPGRRIGRRGLVRDRRAGTGRARSR